MAQDSKTRTRKKAFAVRYPDNWDELTPEEQQKAALAMARDARKQAGKA